MRKKIRRLKIKLQLWNPKWFRNPFYSPALYFMINSVSHFYVLENIRRTLKKDLDAGSAAHIGDIYRQIYGQEADKRADYD